MLPVISEEDEFSDIESEGEIPLARKSPLSNNMLTNHERPSTNVNNLEFWGKLKDFCLDFYNYIACTRRQR